MTLHAAPPGLRGTARYIPEAESLRGIAIVLVFFFHASSIGTESSLHTTGPLSIASAFIYAGHTGVTLFFVLSAFLLAPPFLAEAAGGRRVQRRHYFVRRALRILPAYYVAVLVANLLSDQHGWALLRSVPYLFFSQAIPATVPQLGIYSAVWWSLATEVQFYLALPLLPVFVRTRLGRWCTAAGWVAYAVLYVGFDWYRYGLNSLVAQNALAVSFLGRLPIFLAGIGAAFLHARWGAPLTQWLSGIRWLRLGGADLLLLAVLIGLGVLLRWALTLRLGLELVHHEWRVLEGALWAIVLLQILWLPLRLKPLLCNRGLAAIGRWSYSIYLIHLPALYLSWRALVRYGGWSGRGWTLPNVGYVTLAGGISVLLAALSYRVIEHPFLNWKSNVTL